MAVKKVLTKPYKEGITQSEVLLYICNHEGDKFRLLRKHIDETIGVGTRKPIETQLHKLEDDKIIYSKQTPATDRGYYENSYYMNYTYHAFTSAYNILKSQGKQPQFMATQYYANYLSAKDTNLKLLLDIYKNGMLRLDTFIKHKGIDTVIQCVKNNPPMVNTLIREKSVKQRPLSKSEEVYRQELDALDKQEKDNYNKFLWHLDNLKYDVKSDPFVSKYNQLITDLKATSTDDLPNALVDRAQQREHKKIDPQAYLNYLTEYLAPEYRRADIIGILRLTPLALQYILKPTYLSPSLFANITTLLLDTRVPACFFKPIAEYDIETIFPEDQSPIYSIIKSYFITSYNDGTLIEANDKSEILNRIFTPKTD